MVTQIFGSITEIGSDAWTRLERHEFPFASYEFLEALEVASCLGRRTGWSPAYITAHAGDKLAGAMVWFLKTNSYGEYIFDFAWADAHHRFGVHYYPKLVCAIPFTPVTGPKIFVAADFPESQKVEVRQALLKSSAQLGIKEDSSSSHALFIAEDEIPMFEDAGFFIRHSYQFHWKNQSEHAATMYQFYHSTTNKMGGHAYLTPEFFKRVFLTMRDQILFVLARDLEGRAVAGALNYFSPTTLFGRHWGCFDDYQGLHFELCYYQGIEFAIEQNLKGFEAGAQREHKFHRGFLPTLTYSAHQIEHSILGTAIRDHVAQEKRLIQEAFSDYQSHTPFHRDKRQRN